MYQRVKDKKIFRLGAYMNWKCLVIATALIFVSTASWAQEGASLYKKRCGSCHGANGEGKPAMKAPALKGTTMDADQIAQHVTKGVPGSKAPHNKGMSGVTEDQAKAIAAYIKTL
jgi:mono/diheme cytochrome c family protein